tara:strand:+ start:1879 stop:2136 length:258 start_codon:yes stop_codon:yes gene_type:complete
MDDNEKKYYNLLDDMERQVFNIAKEHLGTSFHIKKSNGYSKYNSDVINSNNIVPVEVIVLESPPVKEEIKPVKKKIRVKKAKIIV